MTRSNQSDRIAARREFLLRVSTAAAAGAAFCSIGQGAESASPKPLPTIQLGPHSISRLICGWNPIGGHSHATNDLSNAMRDWFTVEHTVDLLENCLRRGITAWQYDHTPEAVATLRRLREKTDELRVICLHAERSSDAPIAKVIDDTRPIAIVHHGGVTDSKFRAGKAQEVRDFVKRVKDAGLLAGVSAHCPDNIRRIADEGWENDFFMCCFYYVSRQRENLQKLLGHVPVGETYLETDPQNMTAVMREVPKPCLGFKILAAGRLCWNKKSVESAFQFAYANIKPTDGVIVGMFPRFTDQPAEDAALAQVRRAPLRPHRGSFLRDAATAARTHRFGPTGRDSRLGLFPQRSEYRGRGTRQGSLPVDRHA